MGAITRVGRWTMVAALGIVTTGLVGSPPPAQGLEIVALGHHEFATTASQLTLQRLFPNLRIDSSAVGDFSIFTPIPATIGRKLVGVFVCYTTTNAATFITDTSVAQFLVPGAPALLFTDSTDQASTTGLCYAAFAPGGGVTVGGSVLLQLNLHFGAPGQAIFIGAIGAAFE